MEAKETVMGKEERKAFLENLPKLASTAEVNTAMLEAQAEISFPLGKQEGIREVVEWMPSLIGKIKQAMWSDGWGIEHSVIYPDMLDKLVKKAVQAKLKEWGVGD